MHLTHILPFWNPTSAGVRPADSEDTVGSVAEGPMGLQEALPEEVPTPSLLWSWVSQSPGEDCVQGPQVKALLSSCSHKASVGGSPS